MTARRHSTFPVPAPHWAAAGQAKFGQRRDINDRYLILLGTLLIGYAYLGRGFAYVGVNPLFIGEIVFALGVLAFLRTGCFIAVFTTPPALLLAFLIAWVLARTLPYLPTYGLAAMRDSVIVLYGGFSFIVIALLLEKTSRLDTAVRFMTRFLGLYAVTGGLAYLIIRTARDITPEWPGTGVPLAFLRPGEVAVHLGAATVLAITGLRKFSPMALMLLLGGIILVAAQTRGGMLAIMIPVIFATLVTFRKTVLIIAAALIAAFAAMYALDLGVALPPPDQRVVSARQIVNNFVSVLMPTQESGLDGTKEWRVAWWHAIRDYTLFGDYFWTGKGFGVNLAEADGFVVGEEHGGPPLRSPHNANMTILARAGVPGLALWAALGLGWVWTMLRNMLVARHRGEEAWASLFLLLVCYLMGIIINASFDVALEGPMIGILFWMIFGLGIAASMIYRSPPSEIAAIPSWRPMEPLRR